DDVLIEGSDFSMAPLPAAENGFPVGIVPGENAIDTKASGSAARASIVVRDTRATGFKNGLIANMAAFNIKEHVQATFERVSVSGSHIAFRLRGPGSNEGAWVDITNTVVHDVTYGVRYEDDIERLRVVHTTFGRGVARAFVAAESGWGGLDVRNSAVLGSSLPTEAPAVAGNLAVTVSAFVDPSTGRYAPITGSPLIDAAADDVDGPGDDYLGTSRPQGRAADVGAYESIVSTPSGLALTIAPVASDPTNAVAVSWPAVAGATGYLVERSVDDRTYTVASRHGVTSRQWTNSGLRSGARYWFRLRATTADGASTVGPAVSIALQAEAARPAAPTGLTASRSGAKVTLRWQDRSLEEDGFTIEQSTDGKRFVRLTGRAVNVTWFSHETAPRGTSWYRVVAFNATGQSQSSNVVPVTVP
ncbi:MAG TPA: fibronectin type III domain-containing protein, partial [Luteitalea sp.]|nr:fibronectin type III domain-containing protein [Luteitalea sp.]